ncbi:glycosyltransferase [Streptomyces boluensis]|uniref:Glycosyltransferase n=1 Tax=Streptomyces boluensis TaxID=1775135 RepID=A0A964XPB8_9ACTN|nr:glycosyltransferase [Streptomyces boluensis]NBE54443.1 glycosyltransferase [Streptomyces boluensis]
MTGYGEESVVRALARGGFEEQERVLRERAAEVADEMADGFTRRHPDMAARSGFARWQLAAFAASAAGALVVLIAAPLVLLAVLAALVAVYSLVNALFVLAGLLPGEHCGDTDDPPLPDAELPPYTVLVPAYQESEVIGGLVRHLARLDYPAHLLDVQILVERHDPDTARAVRAADPPPYIRIVELPPGPPQTKPRSVNLGLLLARGELVVIFDAEDRPDLDQLRRVAARFAARDAQLACVQAQLLFQNAATNWLTRQFALEYAMRFTLALPGLARLRLPIPLGGTSNHFRTHVLRTLGGWDAWNVTEDADLGMRCAAMGYRTETIKAVTWEEAVDSVGPFIRQRTRWFKGFLMTTMVHTRRPVTTARRFRASGILVLLGVVASAPVTAMIQPVAVALTVIGLCGAAWSPVGGAVAVPALIAQGVSVVVWVGAMYAAARRVGAERPWHALFTPLYSVLWWVAAWRAAFQLVSSPFTWEKTPHKPTEGQGSEGRPVGVR